MQNLTGSNGSWTETKEKLKQKFAMLTDEDLLLMEGRQDELLGRIQAKIGRTKDDIKKLITDL